VQQLAQKITTVAETQEKMASKRSRSIESAARKILSDDETQESPETQSPPTKFQRATAQTPPTTPPPKGHPDEQGAREGR
jgi:hypothetical protein